MSLRVVYQERGLDDPARPVDIITAELTEATRDLHLLRDDRESACKLLADTDGRLQGAKDRVERLRHELLVAIDEAAAT